jgi:hypothetical protein
MYMWDMQYVYVGHAVCIYVGHAVCMCGTCSIDMCISVGDMQYEDTDVDKLEGVCVAYIAIKALLRHTYSY